MTLPVFDEQIDEDHLDQMMDNATIATNYLKAISHEGRLMILCHLVLEVLVLLSRKNKLPFLL